MSAEPLPFDGSKTTRALSVNIDVLIRVCPRDTPLGEHGPHYEKLQKQVNALVSERCALYRSDDHTWRGLTARASKCCEAAAAWRELHKLADRAPTFVTADGWYCAELVEGRAAILWLIQVAEALEEWDDRFASLYRRPLRRVLGPDWVPGDELSWT
jgi:hypothetical protein